MPDEDVQRSEEGTDASAGDAATDGQETRPEDAPLTEEEMRRRIDEAEARARTAEQAQRTAEIERKVAESERDRAVADKERADRLVTLAAGTVGNAGSMCIGLAISLADDTHYEMVDQIQGLEDSLTAIQELFDALLAEVDPDIIGKAMDAQQTVSAIVAGSASTPDL